MTDRLPMEINVSETYGVPGLEVHGLLPTCKPLIRRRKKPRLLFHLTLLRARSASTVPLPVSLQRLAERRYWKEMCSSKSRSRKKVAQATLRFCLTQGMASLGRL